MLRGTGTWHDQCMGIKDYSFMFFLIPIVGVPVVISTSPKRTITLYIIASATGCNRLSVFPPTSLI